MNKDEQDEFDSITSQPDMRELRGNPMSTAVMRFAYLGLALVIVGGGVSALLLLSWKIAVVTVIVAIGLLLVAAAFSI